MHKKDSPEGPLGRIPAISCRGMLGTFASTGESCGGTQLPVMVVLVNQIGTNLLLTVRPNRVSPIERKNTETGSQLSTGKSFIGDGKLRVNKSFIPG